MGKVERELDHVIDDLRRSTAGTSVHIPVLYHIHAVIDRLTRERDEAKEREQRLKDEIEHADHAALAAIAGATDDALEVKALRAEMERLTAQVDMQARELIARAPHRAMVAERALLLREWLVLENFLAGGHQSLGPRTRAALAEEEGE